MANERVIFLMQGEYSPKIMSLSKKDYTELKRVLKRSMKQRDNFSAGEHDESVDEDYGCYPEAANVILDRAKEVKHEVIDTGADSWGVYKSGEMEG